MEKNNPGRYQQIKKGPKHNRSMVCSKIEKYKKKTKKKNWLDQKYDNRINQFQDNRNFETNQGRFFKNFEGKEEWTKPPNAEDATAFWKGMWSTKVEHKRDAENLLLLYLYFRQSR